MALSTSSFLRYLSVVAEKNMKSFLAEFCDEQAMTLSELGLIKKLHTFRCLNEAYLGSRVLSINVDAKSWNNQFSHDTVTPVMKETVSKIYGSNLPNLIHAKYHQCLVYIDDEHEKYYWDGQDGGIEGHHQDSWVWTYLAMIHTVLDEYGFEYKLLCKGDDLQIFVIVPMTLLEHKSMESIRTEVMNLLHTKLGKLGYEIKILDSYGSEKYFSFGKVASIGTITLPGAVRKIEKTYGANNSFLPLTDDYIGATISNAHNASQMSTNPIACYMVGLFWMYRYILTDNRFKDLSDKVYVAMLIVPSIVGGFPIIHSHNFFVRAESDLLSPFLDMVRVFMEIDPALFRILRRFTHFQTQRKIKLLGLLSDPYSLPIVKPMLLRLILKKSILPLIENEDVLDLLTPDSERATASIVRVLDS